MFKKLKEWYIRNFKRCEYATFCKLYDARPDSYCQVLRGTDYCGKAKQYRINEFKYNLQKKRRQERRFI